VYIVGLACPASSWRVVAFSAGGDARFHGVFLGRHSRRQPLAKLPVIEVNPLERR
jgi:hypothetical protein